MNFFCVWVNGWAELAFGCPGSDFSGTVASGLEKKSTEEGQNLGSWCWLSVTAHRDRTGSWDQGSELKLRSKGSDGKLRLSVAFSPEIQLGTGATGLSLRPKCPGESLLLGLQRSQMILLLSPPTSPTIHPRESLSQYIAQAWEKDDAGSVKLFSIFSSMCLFFILSSIKLW